MTFFSHQYILWFHIPIEDIIFMKKLNNQDELAEDVESLHFC
jgi:hypothetical protein